MSGEKEGKKKKSKGGGKSEGPKIAFWNVAGLNGKKGDLWKKINDWDAVGLVETWVEEKGWERVRTKLPKGFLWRFQSAKRKNKKGRAEGGMITGIKEERRAEKEADGKEDEEVEGMMSREMTIGGKVWKIITVYMNKNQGRIMREIEKKVEEMDRGKGIIVGGDFNARTAQKGGRRELDEEEEREEERREGRRSKDKKENKEGRQMLEWMGEGGWYIMNGGKKGDEEGEFTFTGAGRGSTVIDYAVVREEDWEDVEGFKVGEEMDSDHHPIIVEMNGVAKEEEREEEERGWGEIMDWSEKGIKGYKERMRGKKVQWRGAEKTTQEVEKMVREAIS